MNKRILVKLVVGVMISLFSFNSVSLAAEDHLGELKTQMQPLVDELSANISSDAMAHCKENLAPLFDIDTLAFLQFLDTHYENKSSNSSLNNITILKFREYKKSISDRLRSLSPSDIDRSGESLQIYSEFDNYRLCEGLAAAYVDLAKQKMFDKVRNSTSQKKATALVEKHEAINNQLRDLLFEVAKMYSYFASFKNKLPGFLSDCVTQ